MKKFDAVLLKVFLYELPILVFYAISLAFFGLETAAKENMYAKVWYDFGGLFVFGSWMTVSICISLRLIMSSSFRSNVLSKITFLREQDEREIVLTGQAAKNTMLTTLAVLILLFCLSCFQFSVYRIPPEQAVDGKSRVLTLGLNFKLLDVPQQQGAGADKEKADIISYSALPISSSTVIIGIIGWQIISYNYLMRRTMKAR